MQASCSATADFEVDHFSSRNLKEHFHDIKLLSFMYIFICYTVVLIVSALKEKVSLIICLLFFKLHFSLVVFWKVIVSVQ